MGTFGRRLPKESWDALEDLMCKASWWPDLLAHWAPSGNESGLRLAIRDGYINFYLAGQSIGKLTFGHGGNKPTIHVHHKYVIPNAQGQRYLKCSGESGLDDHGRPVHWSGSDMLQEWMSYSGRHRGNEKTCIEKVVAMSPKVIDLEMGLPAIEGQKTALRMDIVSLEPAMDRIRLVFWEAKMIGNSELRSKTHKPKVVKQVHAYKAYLTDGARRQRIVEAYRESCRIIRDLHRMASCKTTKSPLDPLILAAAEPDSPLEIEQSPRLLIFDDERKRREDKWQEHLDVLCKEVPVTIVQCKATTLRPLESMQRVCG